ncbi:response regulator [Oxalobacteraceae bacterium CAVE-383]|nr:response regulator [Oxalobacteraceae bacterium CAVE-383]
MKRLRMATIQHKVLGVVLLTTLVAVITALGAIIAYSFKTGHDDLIKDLATQSELLGHMTAPALTFNDRKLAAENLSLFRFRPTLRAAAIYDTNGVLFATYTAPGDRVVFPSRALRDTSFIEDTDLIVYKNIYDNGEFLGTVYLRDRYPLLKKAVGFVGIAAVATTIAMLVAFLFSLRLQRLVTGPILAIARVAREVGQSRDYSQRTIKASNDEVGVLSDSFNDMLAQMEFRTAELLHSNQEIAREATQRSAAQQEIMRLNEALENRVRQRTAELETANAHLQIAKASADEANQAKSAFLSSMSHELRTPLNAILGFAQLLTSQLSESPGKREEFVGFILKAGNHLLVLINEILDLAKIESGTLTLSLEPVALLDVMQECEKMIAPIAGKRAITLAFSVDGNVHVTADRTRLKQILLNLLSNAIKYNREGGSIEISTVASGECVRIAVKDTGNGLSPAQIEQIFQPFNRLGQEVGPEEGTGIGLVVTKRLIEMMNGEIGVESEVGAGSVFWLTLQACDTVRNGHVPELEKLGAIAAGNGSMPTVHSILYVEDNPANLRLVQEIINLRPDFHLLTASDAGLGIEIARAHQPRLILMDLNLPGISGIDALKKLQSDTLTAHIPVIALTANAMPRDIERGLAEGFIGYLTKPIDIGRFLTVVDQALEKYSGRTGADG